MVWNWVYDGKWSGPLRGVRGGGKGNRKEQTIRQKAKRQLVTLLAEEARKLAREAGTARGQGRPAGSQSKDQEQKAKWIRRRLCGKQKPLGVTAFAKTAMAKLAAARAEAAAQQAKGKAQENTAEEVQTKIIGLAQIASQAKTEAEQARARARAADKQAEENHAIAKRATDYADNLWKRCIRLVDSMPKGSLEAIKTCQVVGPPFFGGL